MSINYICNRLQLNNEPNTYDLNFAIYNEFSSIYEMNLIEEDDINDISKRYMLLHPLQEHISKKLARGEMILSDTILKKIKSGFNIDVFFCTEAECEFENCYELMHSFLSTNELPSNHFYIASGNSKLENINQYGINAIKNYNPIINRISGTLNSHTPFGSIDWLVDKKYLFQCYNNHAKPHRIALLTLLQNKKLLNKVDWSLMRSMDVVKLGDAGLNNLSLILSNDDIHSLRDDFVFILNKGNSKYSEYEDESIRNPNADGEPDHNITYEANPHKNAYINIVNESQFELKNTIHVTEKSLIPFHFYQLPLFVATQGHVKKMKELYGFDMFDDVIDHSYDFIENTNDRMLAILSEIDRLNNNEEFIREFYKSNKERFENNAKIINSLSFVNPYKCIIDEFLK